MRAWLSVVAALALGAGAASAETPVKVRIAWVVPIGNWASIIYEKKDLMTHYGKSYEVEAIHFNGTPPMIQALATGELDIADLAFSSFALAVENAGMTDLRVIADESQEGIEGYATGDYFVLKDGPVHAIEDLKGKVLATVGAGAALDIPVRAMLREHGLEDRRDYTTVEAAFPNMTAMLLDRKIDFMPSVSPFAREQRLLQNARPLFTVREAMGGPAQFIVWTARAGFIDQHRAAMVDLLEDAVRVAHFLTNPDDHAAVVALAAKVSHQPAANLDYVYTHDDIYRDRNMLPNLVTFQRAIDMQQEMGFLKATLDVPSHADLSLVTEAAARVK